MGSCQTSRTSLPSRYGKALQKAQAMLLHGPYHRAGEAAGGSSLHNTPPETVTRSSSVLEDGNRMAVIAVLFLVNLHFSFLVSQYRYSLIPIAHAVTCWRTDIVSSRSAASSLRDEYFQLFLWAVLYLAKPLRFI